MWLVLLLLQVCASLHRGLQQPALCSALSRALPVAIPALPSRGLTWSRPVVPRSNGTTRGSSTTPPSLCSPAAAQGLAAAHSPGRPPSTVRNSLYSASLDRGRQDQPESTAPGSWGMPSESQGPADLPSRLSSVKNGPCDLGWSLGTHRSDDTPVWPVSWGQWKVRRGHACGSTCTV